MEPETRYTVIGAVVLALIGAAVFGYVWLSSSGRASDFRYYTVYFEKQSLSGLQVGGNVNMRGITVGRVEDYSLSRDNVNRVKVNLRVARDTPVRENTRGRGLAQRAHRHCAHQPGHAQGTVRPSW